MADRKITELTALAAGSQATGDLLAIVDVSETAAADKNKKITVESLFKGIPGNVGVGTASPSTNLEINGGTNNNIVRIVSTDANANIEFADNTTTSGCQIGANGDNLKFGISGTERMRIDSSGNVGIGLTSPGAPLAVASSGGINAKLVGRDNGTVDEAQLYFMHNDNSTVHGIIEGKSTSLNLYGGTTLAQTIDSSGNVGIATTSPSAPLAFGKSDYGEPSSEDFYRIKFKDNGGTENDVGIGMPNANSLGFNSVSNGSIRFYTGTDGESMRIDDSGRLLVGTTLVGNSEADDLTVANTGTTGITIRSGTSGNGNLFFADSASGNAAFDGFIQYQHANRSLKFGTAASEQMRIDSSGNVGIGTTNPTQKLSLENGTFKISGASTFADNVEIGRVGNDNNLAFATGGTERVRIKSGGEFRASTNTSDSNYYANPATSHVFHVDANDNAVMILENSGNNTPYGLLINFHDAAPDDNTRYAINFSDSVGTKFRVYSDGDVANADNSYGALSDQKLKQDIVDAGSQWNDIKDLRVRNFKLKDDVAAYGDEAKTLIGVVAQEIELVSPGLVKDSHDLDADNNDLGTVTKSVNYSVLYMKAVKALQEAQTRIETLESQHADLLARVAALESG